MTTILYRAGFSLARIGAGKLIIAASAVALTVILAVGASMQKADATQSKATAAQEDVYKRIYEASKVEDIKAAWAAVRDTKQTAERRLEALAVLEKLQPEEFKTQQLELLRVPLAREAKVENEAKAKAQKLADAADAKRQKVMSAERKALAKTQGVNIGFTREMVLASSWGKPSSINTTHTVRGTSEQWVYGQYSHGYLYFTDGILTTIQN